jgi:hypothetical protein
VVDEEVEVSEDTEVTELIDMAATQLRSTLETVLGPASTSAVFSEPRMVGDDLVFTAAAWERGGAGSGSAEVGETTRPEAAGSAPAVVAAAARRAGRWR